jgi:hypothetical protein
MLTLLIKLVEDSGEVQGAIELFMQASGTARCSETSRLTKDAVVL